jgi:Ca2+-binding EF-hand superfamily protein
VIPFAAVGKLLSVVRTGQQAQKVSTTAVILRTMPEGSLRVLSLLKFHVRKVVSHEATNKMSLPNVMLVFAPNLLRKDEGPSVADIPHQLAAMAIIFGDDPEIDAVLGTSQVTKRPKGIKSRDPAMKKRHFNLDDSTPSTEFEAEMRSGGAAAPVTPSPTKLAMKRSTADSVMRSSVYAKKPTSPVRDPAKAAEALQLEMSVTLTPEAEFALYDADGDRRLTLPEVIGLSRARGSLATATSLRDMFETADATSLGAISFDEYSLVFGARGEKAAFAPPHDCVTAFGALDKGGTGTVSAEEVAHACLEYGGADRMDAATIRQLIAELHLDRDHGLDYRALASGLEAVL